MRGSDDWWLRVHDESVSLRRATARDDRLPLRYQELLLGDTEAAVRRSLARNPALHPRCIAALLFDPNKEVVRNVRRYQDLEAERTRREIDGLGRRRPSNESEPWFAYFRYQNGEPLHGRFEDADLIWLAASQDDFDSRDSAILEMIAWSCEVDLHQILRSGDTWHRARAAVVCRRHRDLGLLTVDPSKEVRKAACWNPFLTKKVLLALINDRSGEVRKEARKRQSLPAPFVRATTRSWCRPEPAAPEQAPPSSRARTKPISRESAALEEVLRDFHSASLSVGIRVSDDLLHTRLWFSSSKDDTRVHALRSVGFPAFPFPTPDQLALSVTQQPVIAECGRSFPQPLFPPTGQTPSKACQDCLSSAYRVHSGEMAADLRRSRGAILPNEVTEATSMVVGWAEPIEFEPADLACDDLTKVATSNFGAQLGPSAYGLFEPWLKVLRTLGRTSRSRTDKWLRSSMTERMNGAAKCIRCSTTFALDGLRPTRLSDPRSDYTLGATLLCLPCRDRLARGATYRKPEDSKSLRVALRDWYDSTGELPAHNWAQAPLLDGSTGWLSSDAAKELILTRIDIRLRMPNTRNLAFQELLGRGPAWAGLLHSAGLVEREQGPLGQRAIGRDGHICLSLSELALCNALSIAGIAHEKEPTYPSLGRKRADFLIRETYVEYAGLEGNVDYEERLREKVQAARDSGHKVCVVWPRHLPSILEQISSGSLSWLETGAEAVP